MKVVVGSAFRNAAGLQADRFLSQVCALSVHAGPAHHVRVAAVEGDSADNTASYLLQKSALRGVPLDLSFCSHGGPVFGSTEAPARLEALTRVGNSILDAVRADDDVLVYVESDLIWDAHTVGSLIDAAVDRRAGFDVFAPLVFAGDNFYDVFAFRKDGQRFSPFEPYHAGLKERGFTEVDSAGSCLVMRSEVARAVRIPPGGVLVGWCEAARAAGYRIAVSSDFRVRHPA